MHIRSRISRCAGPVFLAGLACILALLSGCATREAYHQISYDEWAARRYRSALNAKQPSEYSLRYLRRHDVVQAYAENPRKVLADMDRALCSDPTREQLFVLSELSYQAGVQAKTESEDARLYFLSATRYGYAFLFAKDAGPLLSEFDPRFRIAIDLYNHSLASAFERRRSDWKTRLDGEARALLVRGYLIVEEAAGGPIELDDIDRGTAAHRLEISILENHFQRSGIGLPLLAVRDVEREADPKDEGRDLIRLARVFSATTLLRFPEAICDADVEQDGVRAVLESFDPVKTPTVTIGEREVPLEADLTIPLAFLLDEGNQTVGGGGLASMYRKLQGDYIGERRGLILLEPHVPGKIPVVFVHGLLSSPYTWLQLINDLMADPALTSHFEFLFFFYPTGNPILYSASELRTLLRAYRDQVDPEHTDPAWDQMVLVGHSMGGLLTRLMITSSDGDFVRGLTGRSLDELDLDEEDAAAIRKVDTFEPLPFVSRVLFLATPHRGADMARGPIGRIGDAVNLFPRYMLEDMTGVLAGIGIEKQQELSSGIDNLEYDSNFMKTLASRPLDPRVPYHLIIGNRKSANTPGGTDGVVKYDSSHIDGAVSEKIVKSGHDVQTQPPTVLELQRILLEHLEEKKTTPTGASKRPSSSTATGFRPPR